MLNGAMGFKEKLLSAASKSRSWLCIGLDPDPERIPRPLRDGGPEAALEFNREVIEATSDLVCAYKPNIAFYQALGPGGLEVLKRTCELIPPEIPVILDAKWGDIANTSGRYAQAAFEVFEADAVTLSPYLGYDAIEPFLDFRDRAAFLLCRTSNPGARDLQDLSCEGKPLYQVVAELCRSWSGQAPGELGVVAAATYPDELKAVRRIVGEDMMILVPGVGAQAGDLDRAVRSAANSKGERAIISASRSVIYASEGEDFAEAARKAAESLRNKINEALGEHVRREGDQRWPS